jgi:chloride channel protein, CIC family
MGEGSEVQGTRAGQSTRPRPWRSSHPELPAPSGYLRRISRDERFTTLVVAVVVGVCGGIAALVFRSLVEGTWWLFARVATMGTVVQVGVVLGLPTLGGLVVGVLFGGRTRAPGDHGLVGIKAAFITSGGVLRTRLAIERVIACAITTSSGGSAGCEGPIARVAGAVGSWLALRLGLHRSRLQVLAACGVSASLAGLFHTPIAAVVFATEVVLGGYAIRSLAPLVISSATATVVARAVAGKHPAFDVPSFVLQGPMDLIVHLVIGVACGVAAAGFIHLLDRFQAANIRVPLAVQPALGGLLVGLIALAVPGVVGVGYPALGSLFRGDMTVWVIVVLLLGKLLATTVTLASRGAGGVFAPSLLVGGTFGWLVGHVANQAFPGMFAPPGAFAAAGMAAMMAGVTHAPFTGAVLLVECTQSYHAVLPGVVAALAASIVSSTIRDESAYAMVLSKRGLREPSERHTTALSASSIQPLLDPVQDTVPSNLPARELLRRLSVARSEVLIVASAGKVLGVIPVGAAAKRDPDELADQPATALMVDTGTLGERDSVARALVQFMRHDAPAMPVVGASGLLGLVWRSDLMDFCAHDMLRDYLQIGGAALPSVSETAGRPLSHDVAALPVPRIMVGRTLREVDLGKQFGVVCVGLRRATEAGSFVAVHLSPRLELRVDDVMILTGNASDLERLSRLTDDGPPSTEGPR